MPEIAGLLANWPGPSSVKAESTRSHGFRTHPPKLRTDHLDRGVAGAREVRRNPWQVEPPTAVRSRRAGHSPVFSPRLPMNDLARRGLSADDVRQRHQALPACHQPVVSAPCAPTTSRTIECRPSATDQTGPPFDPSCPGRRTRPTPRVASWTTRDPHDGCIECDEPENLRANRSKQDPAWEPSGRARGRAGPTIAVTVQGGEAATRWMSAPATPGQQAGPPPFISTPNCARNRLAVGPESSTRARHRACTSGPLVGRQWTSVAIPKQSARATEICRFTPAPTTRTAKRAGRGAHLDRGPEPRPIPIAGHGLRNSAPLPSPAPTPNLCR